MVSKSTCISIFNAKIRGIPVYINSLLPMVEDYLTEINYENYNKLIYLISQNPQLLEIAFPTIEEYFCRKFCIYKLIFNNKIILYYE